MLDAVTVTSICPGPGGTRSNATSSIDSRSPGVRICRRIPSCSWSTTVVRRSSGRSGVGRKPRRVPLAVPPRGFVLFGSAEQLLARAARRPSSSSTSIWVARRCGCSVPITRMQATQPGLLQIGHVAGQHGLSVPGHDIQPGRLAREVGQLAGDAHQMAAHTPRRAAQTAPRGCRSRAPSATTTPRTPRAEAAQPSSSALAVWSAFRGQAIVVHRAPAISVRRSDVVASRSALVGGADQQPCPASRVRRRAVLAAAIRW